MAYRELIKNFAHIREYMRQFYVYGFRSRSQYDGKSARSYDDEKRRIESWLGDYMKFSRTDSGKNVFLSIDSRASRRNPLYKAWKSKSFTDRDITLHFIIFDIFHDVHTRLTLNQLLHIIETEYLSSFESPVVFDESTLRKKLKEYISLGIISTEKQGKKLLYRRSTDYDITPFSDLLDFFSEVSPCGVAGSYMLDRLPPHKGLFAFKHHYITHALDIGIMYSLFCAIGKRQNVRIQTVSRGGNRTDLAVTPLKIYISSQNGRQYLMAAKQNSEVTAFRIDYITDVTVLSPADNFDALRQKLNDMSQYIWGANISEDGSIETVEFSVYFSDDEQHIYNRLIRERRCGTVTLDDRNNATFKAQVYDSRELIPWIRTFICRITCIKFSNKELEKSFMQDMKDMYRLYGLE